MNNKTQYYILSSHNIDLLENELRSFGIVRFKRVEGIYKGISEVSLMIIADHTAFNTINELSIKHFQECFLYSDSSGYVTLHYGQDGLMVSLGTRKTITYTPTENCTKLNDREYLTIG